MTELNAALLDSLADKIEGLDLSSDESATLDLIFERAAALDSDDDVSGFQHWGDKKVKFPTEMQMVRRPMGLKLGMGAGVEASVLTPTAEGRV